jgi:hypothetical protein
MTVGRSVGEGDPASGDPYDIIMNDIAGIKVWAARWGADNLETLKAMTQDVRHPPGSMYEHSVIEPLRTAHTILQDEVRSDFGKLKHTVDNWSGDAAENFATNFYHEFEDMTPSQERVFEALVGGLSTVKAIEESAQHSLMNAVHYLREMLLEQLELRQQQGNASQERREPSLGDSVKAITILAAGAAVLSAAVPGKLWAIGMEAAAGGLSIAASSIPADAAAEFTLHGQTAEVLLGTLLDAIDAIKKHTEDQYEALEVELGTVRDRVELLRGGPDPDGEDGRLYPIRPAIVDGVDSDTFRHGPTTGSN